MLAFEPMRDLWFKLHEDRQACVWESDTGMKCLILLALTHRISVFGIISSNLWKYFFK